MIQVTRQGLNILADLLLLRSVARVGACVGRSFVQQRSKSETARDKQISDVLITMTHEDRQGQPSTLRFD